MALKVPPPPLLRLRVSTGQIRDAAHRQQPDQGPRLSCLDACGPFADLPEPSNHTVPCCTDTAATFSCVTALSTIGLRSVPRQSLRHWLLNARSHLLEPRVCCLQEPLLLTDSCLVWGWAPSNDRRPTTARQNRRTLP
ncbi:hypothetical protein CCMA1212_000074 [Trichoderma ghanense]|uniref:Uncharacterized protein n=1 Tax=Trichoderma ghanense TaxID=65468 RepID=A0ABY2HIT5_9HYPO